MTKTPIKRHFVYAIWLIIVIGLVGCGRASTNSATESVTITFMVFGDPAERDAYRTLVSAFELSHPSIKVALTHIPSPRDYRTRLATDYAAGSPPDVSLMNYRRFAAFAASDLLEPLDDRLANSDLIASDQFFPIALDAFDWQGETMCIPQNISSLVVYYNRSLFDKAGVAYPADDWTWDDFLATAQALTLDTNGDGQIEQHGLGIAPSLYRLAPFIWQNGGRMVDNPVNPKALGITLPASREALAWFTALQTEHHVVPDRVAEASLDSESRFTAGLTAMFLNSRRGVPTYRQIDGFVWDVAPLPQRWQQAGVLHSDGYCLSSKAGNKDAAWTFIEYANSVAGQTIIAESGRTVPSLMAVAESAAFLDPTQLPAHSDVWLNTVDSLQLVPVISTWEEIEKVAGEEIERAFYGDITPDEAGRTAVIRTGEYFLFGR